MRPFSLKSVLLALVCAGVCSVSWQSASAQTPRPGSEVGGNNLGAARDRAQQTNIEIETFTGTGPGGTITKSTSTVWDGGGSSVGGSPFVGGLKQRFENLEKSMKACADRNDLNAKQRFQDDKAEALNYLNTIRTTQPAQAEAVLEIAKSVYAIGVQCADGRAFTGNNFTAINNAWRPFKPLVEAQEARKRAAEERERQQQQQQQAQPSTDRRTGMRIQQNRSPSPRQRAQDQQFANRPSGPSTFMPTFNIGFAGGGTNIGGGGSGDPLAVSLDTFGGGSIVNSRPVDTPSAQGTLGFFATMEVPLPGMPAAAGFPAPTSFFVRTGALFPTDGEVTTPISFTGTVPLGSGTVTIKDSASVPLLFGFGFPVNFGNVPVIVQLGGGGFFTTRETTVTIREAGAAGTPAFSNSISESFFDPAFTGGIRVAAGDLNGDGRNDLIFGLDTIIRSRSSGDNVVLQSPNFASQSYTVVSNRSGTDASIIASLNVDLNSFFAFDPTFRGGARVAAR